MWTKSIVEDPLLNASASAILGHNFRFYQLNKGYKTKILNCSMLFLLGTIRQSNLQAWWNQRVWQYSLWGLPWYFDPAHTIITILY